jgi:DNA-binding response OmpR family regulator
MATSCIPSVLRGILPGNFNACPYGTLFLNGDEGRGMSEDARSRQARLPRILVIETNPGYRSVISHVVEIAGGQWDSVSEIEQGIKLLDGNRKFALVIIGVDAESGIDPEVLKEIRSLAQAPLIILDETYNGALETFDAGAEQILPKPFVPDALIGAIKVELRGPSPSSLVPLATRIELGGLVFDAHKRVVLRGETQVRFTKREWEVLAFFLASPNQYFRAEEILAQTWGTDASAEQLRTYFTRMRQKLSPFQAWCKLVTEKGRGYCLLLEGAPNQP